MGEVADDGEEAGEVEAGGEVVEVGVGVAEAAARGPAEDVVGGPGEGHAGGREVLELRVKDEEGGGELAVAPELAEGHEGEERGEEGQGDAEDQVGGQGGGGVRWWDRGGDDHGGFRGGGVVVPAGEKEHIDGGGGHGHGHVVVDRGNDVADVADVVHGGLVG